VARKELTMIRPYQHVAITVSDLDRSVKFYQDIFGFEPLRSMEASGEEVSRALGMEGVNLRLRILTKGEYVLELFEYHSPEGSKTAPRPCDVGCMHIAFEVDDIQRVYREFTAKGVHINTPPNRNPDGIGWTWWCYMRDPDGVPIELVQIKP
jgi:catechol 2,3-dioxygenase-like lactoylglutathione lyase family enzyme